MGERAVPAAGNTQNIQQGWTWQLRIDLNYSDFIVRFFSPPSYFPAQNSGSK